MFIFGLPIRENRQAFSPETKNTRYMKKLSIALLALTTVQAAMTGEGTALIVAFVLFCHTCGKDVERIWGRLINEKGDAFTSPRKEDYSMPNKSRCKDTQFL